MSNVIRLNDYRKGRTPLVVSHVDGTVRGGEPVNDRQERIKTSLDRINKLMTELRGRNVYD